MSHLELEHDGASPMAVAERVALPYRVIRLPEIVNHYFSEDSHPPREQTATGIRLINNLLASSNSFFYIDHESMLPILSNDQTHAPYHLPLSPDQPPPCFKLYVPFHVGHIGNGYEYVKDSVSSELEKATDRSTGLMVQDKLFSIERVEPKKVDLSNENTRVYRVTDSQIQLGYIILEEKERYLGNPRFRHTNFTITYAIDNPNRKKECQLQPLRTVCSFELTNNNSSHNQRNLMTNWDDNGKAEWKTDSQGDPYVFYSEEQMAIISEPLNIKYWEFESLFKMCSRYSLDGHLITKEEIRYGNPRYYLELALIGAKMLYQTVFNEPRVNSVVYRDDDVAKRCPKYIDDAIEPYTKDRLKSNLLKYGRTKTDYNGNKVEMATNQYTQGEYYLYELIWQGKNIWKDLSEFSNLLTRAYHHNPDRFWYYFYELGMDYALPFFRDITPGRNGQALVYTPGMFDLLPNLSKYYNADPGKEYEQSDNYFMEACLALASSALEEKEEPFAALVVKDGKIISYAYNEINKHDDETKHAEIIAMRRAQDNLDGDKTLHGCTLYTTTTPCDACTYTIRRRKGIDQIKCGVETNQANLEKLTDPNLAKTEEKAGLPPVVTIGLLEDEVHDFYTNVVHYTYPFIRHKRGLRVIDTYHRIPGVSYFRDETVEYTGSLTGKIPTFHGETLI